MAAMTAMDEQEQPQPQPQPQPPPEQQQQQQTDATPIRRRALNARSTTLISLHRSGTRSKLNTEEGRSSDEAHSNANHHDDATEDAAAFTGPSSARLHRFDVSLRIVQVLIILWILSGLSLWLTGLFCIVVNISFATFNATPTVVQLWSPIYGLGANIVFVWLMSRSMVRTFMRLVKFVWTLRAGAALPGEEDVFFRNLYAFAERIVKMHYGARAARQPPASRDASDSSATEPVSDQQQPKQDQTAITEDMESRIAQHTDKVGNILFLCVIATALGLPLLIVSIAYGYWIVISYITVGSCVASAGFLLLVNLIKRIMRSANVLDTLNTFPEEMSETSYLRASYIATLGLDDGLDLVAKIAGLVIGTSFWVAFLSYLFSSASIALLAVCGAIIIIGAIARTPFVLSYLSPMMGKTYLSTVDGREYFTGEQFWPVFVVFIMRIVFYVFSFTSLLYYDGSYTDPSALLKSNNAVTFSIIIVFVLLALLRDALFVFPVSSKSSKSSKMDMQSRSFLLGITTIGMVIVSITAVVLVGGYASATALLSAYLSIDFRHPRCAWTMYANPFFSNDLHQRAKQRGIMNTRNALHVLGCLLFAALAIGFVVGGTKSAVTVAQDMSDQPLIGTKFLPPICSINIRGLSIIDFSEMSNSTYADNPIDVVRNSTFATGLSNVTVGISGAADPTGKSFFIEYRLPPPSVLSIVAIRGTSSFSDVFQDIFLYSTVGLLQGSSYFGTLVDL
eukprot:jgi/Hompol1/1932/HPOL_005788-RA